MFGCNQGHAATFSSTWLHRTRHPLLRSEEHQRQRAIGDRQDAVAGAMHHREHAAAGPPISTRSAAPMGCINAARRADSSGCSRRKKPNSSSRPDLLGPDQGTHHDGGGERRAAGLQEARQVGSHRRADEPGGGKDRGQPHASAFGLCTSQRRRAAGGGGLLWRRDRTIARGSGQQQVERQIDQQMHCRPRAAGTPPPHMVFEQARQRPADVAGKPGDQRDK